MKFKLLRTRLIILLVLLTLIVVFHYSLSSSSNFLNWYTTVGFSWLQHQRNIVLNHLSISIGDYLYLFLGLFLLLLLIRFIYFSFRYKSNKEDFWKELMRILTFPSVVYLAFLILWGGNYARPSIVNHWNLDDQEWNESKLVELNQDLVEKINKIRSDSFPFSNFKVMNLQANNYYHDKLGIGSLNLKIKHTSLGYMLNYLGINGYYNPLSGEAQFNRFIPKFMHPFVITHEMAHQIGIAAEDEANLLAYIICVESQDPAFRYSGYFNLFLYAINDLKSINEAHAELIMQQLNANTKKDLAELKEMRLKYKSRFRGISLYLYDEYLRWHGQQEGIQSYAGMVKWAYYWGKSKQQLTNTSPIQLQKD